LKTILLSLVLIFVLCTQSSLAESSVWKVQKGASVIYLGGTIHLLRPADFPLPLEFKKAYRAADAVVFETDIAALNSPAIQQQIMSKGMYADGSTIEQYLSAKTNRLLRDYCEKSGIPFTSLKQFKPSIISLMLTLVELSKLGVAQEGVDKYFYQLAKKDKKLVAGLETVEQQINLLVRMGKGNEDAFIAYSIDDLKTTRQKYTAMLRAWKRGEEKKLNALIVEPTRKKMPTLYQELLVDRNRNWLPMIEAYSKTPEKELVLVGVGHLVGEDGIIAALKNKGYTVEKL
jgi:uncharacterized protein YbaP (TraB family)